MMYGNPSWWLYGKMWGSKDSVDAADEYEEEVFPALAVIGGVIILGLIVFSLWKLLGGN